MIKRMKNMKGEVRQLLKDNDSCRDSDAKLVATFYYKKFGGKEVFEKKTAFDFLKVLAEGKIPFPDYITRVRRKLQETEPELRGASYKKRHKLSDEVTTNIHKL